MLKEAPSRLPQKIRCDETTAAAMRSVQELRQPALPAPLKTTELEHKKDDSEEAAVWVPTDFSLGSTRGAKLTTIGDAHVRRMT